MKNILLSGAALLLITTAAVFGQNDSTRYINGLPVTEDDTAAQAVSPDVEPFNTYSPVAIEDIPPKLRERLDRGKQYVGWQDSTIYLERNTGLYLVPVKYDEGVRLFGLTEKGEPVTFNELIISKQK